MGGDALSQTKQALRERWLKGGLARSPGVGLVPEPQLRHEPFPLTLEQGRLVQALRAGAPRPLHYLELETPALDLPRLTAAWRALMAHHDMLRAERWQDHQQRILQEPPPFAITQYADSDTACQAVLAGTGQGALAAAWGGRGKESRLHLAFDGLWLDAPSIHVLAMQWRQQYQEPHPLESLSLSFRDYMLVQKARGVALADGLADAPTPPRPPALDFATTTRRESRIPPAQWMRHKRWLAQSGVTPSGAVLCVLAQALGRRAQLPSHLGMTLFERQPLHPQINDLIGNFTAVVPLAVDPPKESLLVEARRLQERMMTALSQPRTSDLAVTALLPVLFTSALAALTDGSVATAHAAAAVQRPFDWLGIVRGERSQRPDAALELLAMEDVEGALFVASFDERAFAPVTIEQLLGEVAATLTELT